MAVRELVQNQAEGVTHFETLRQFTRDVIDIRRTEHRIARLEFEKEKFDYDLTKLPL